MFALETQTAVFSPASLITWIKSRVKNKQFIFIRSGWWRSVELHFNKNREVRSWVFFISDVLAQTESWEIIWYLQPRGTQEVLIWKNYRLLKVLKELMSHDEEKLALMARMQLRDVLSSHLRHVIHSLWSCVRLSAPFSWPLCASWESRSLVPPADCDVLNPHTCSLCWSDSAPAIYETFLNLYFSSSKDSESPEDYHTH